MRGLARGSAIRTVPTQGLAAPGVPHASAMADGNASAAARVAEPDPAPQPASLGRVRADIETPANTTAGCFTDSQGTGVCSECFVHSSARAGAGCFRDPTAIGESWAEPGGTTGTPHRLSASS